MVNSSCKECGSPIDRESGLPDIVDPHVVDLVRAFFRDLEAGRVPLTFAQYLELTELRRLLGGW